MAGSGDVDLVRRTKVARHRCGRDQHHANAQRTLEFHHTLLLCGCFEMRRETASSRVRRAALHETDTAEVNKTSRRLRGGTTIEQEWIVTRCPWTFNWFVRSAPNTIA